MSSHIKFKKGDLFTSKASTLVNPVNCVGTAGAGLAQVFARKIPQCMPMYKDLCYNKSLHVGYPMLWKSDIEKVPNVLFFPTKIHFRNKSEEKWIEDGLDRLLLLYDIWGIDSIAFPLLGTGLGGLEVDTIKALIYTKMLTFKGNVEIYTL